MSTRTKGFTLVELLVVIAIISLIASIVVASLNNARNKARDVAVKTNLLNARSQAEQYVTSFASFEFNYDTICEPETSGGIYSMVAAAAAESEDPIIAIDSPGAVSNSTCNDSPEGWAAEIPLKSSPGGFLCVDNSGKAVITAGSSLDSSDDVSCL